MGYRTPVTTAAALGVTFPLLAIIFVIARFWARRKKRMALRLDDWILIPALSLAIGNAIVLLVAATRGNLGRMLPLGGDGFPIPNPEFETFQKCIYANQLISTLSIGVTRYAILLFYNRIFAGHTFNKSVWVLYVVNGIWTIAYTFLFMFGCVPISAFWKAARGQKSRHCIPLTPIKVYAVSSIFIDVAMLLIPWPPILKLHITRKQKIAVLSIFGLGAIVLGVAIGKCYEFWSVIRTISKDHQIAYDEAPTMYWTIPETCVAVICACLPTLRPLFHGWSPESIVRSVRSALSLHSIGLQRSQSSSESRSRHGLNTMQVSGSLLNIRHNDIQMPWTASNNLHDKDAIQTEVTGIEEGYHLKDEP